MAKRDKGAVTVTGAGQYSKTLTYSKGERGSISIDGTFVATITVQRRLDGQNWRDVQAFTGPVERDLIASENMEMRIGCKTGDFTSGAAECRIGK